MSRVAVRRVADDLLIEVDLATSRVRGDRKALALPHREALLAYMLVAAAPTVVAYRSIHEKILEPDGIGQPPSDPMVYTRQLKLKVNRHFEVTTGASDLIASVRGLGYFLDGDWVRERGPQEDRDLSFERLRELAQECVSVMQGLSLVADDEGVLSLHRSQQDDRANSIVADYDVLVAQLLARNDLSGDERLGSIHWSLIREIRSYFLFARSGHVAPATWRRLFEEELLANVEGLRRISVTGREE